MPKEKATTRKTKAKTEAGGKKKKGELSAGYKITPIAH